MKIKKQIAITVINIFLIVIAGRVLFILPNNKFLNILNVNDYHILACIILTITILIISVFFNVEKQRRSILLLVVSVVTFAVIGGYYYAHLPQYTYNDAVEIIRADVANNDDSISIFMPEQRVNKIGLQRHKILRITNYVYYIHVMHGEQKVIYRFYPLTGQYEKTDIEME